MVTKKLPMVNPNVKWQRYLIACNPAIISYLSRYGDEILRQTYERLISAHKNKKSQIILFRFKDSDIVSIIRNDEYIYALECLLALCSSIEKYELCRDIHNQLKIIKLKKARGRTPKAKVTIT